MTQIQIDLNEEENRKVEIHRAKKGFVTKVEAIKDIIDNSKGN